MRLWVESAYQTIAGAANEPSGDFVGALTTEDVFAAIVASNTGEYLVSNTQYLFRDALSSLTNGVSLEAVAESLLTSLPPAAHVPFALLRAGPSSVSGRRSAQLVECDAPPLFMARRGRLVLLPVIEEEAHGHLIRRCDFELRDGDHLALVSEGYIQASGWDRRFGWRDIAVSIRRLTETRCDAGQLVGALARLANSRLPTANGKLQICNLQSAICILAMFVRPMRTATVWSGPPAKRSVESEMLAQLMAEEDMRILCGDTTAEIAARLLGAELVMEPPPEEGWGEVPPVSRMIGRNGAEPVALVTEGVVTMHVARERLTQAKRHSDLAGRSDGASRLAKLMLTADKVRFLVGLAVNPAQIERDGTPLRKAAVAGLAKELKARGKIILVEHM